MIRGRPGRRREGGRQARGGRRADSPLNGPQPLCDQDRMGWTMLLKVDRTVSDLVNWRGVDEQGAGR
jgi:hypothetical protein